MNEADIYQKPSEYPEVILYDNSQYGDDIDEDYLDCGRMNAILLHFDTLILKSIPFTVKDSGDDANFNLKF